MAYAARRAARRTGSDRGLCAVVADTCAVVGPRLATKTAGEMRAARDAYQAARETLVSIRTPNTAARRCRRRAINSLSARDRSGDERLLDAVQLFELALKRGNTRRALAD